MSRVVGVAPKISVHPSEYGDAALKDELSLENALKAAESICKWTKEAWLFIEAIKIWYSHSPKEIFICTTIFLDASLTGKKGKVDAHSAIIPGKMEKTIQLLKEGIVYEIGLHLRKESETISTKLENINALKKFY